MARPRYCVFCGSSPGARPEYADAARALGRELAARGSDLVYGGGNVGLMGILADAAMEAGAHVIGVIPDGLLAREVGHRGIADLRVVASMHERKALMSELSAGFLALAGGLGTFEELLEMLTWAQLGVHDKPCAVVNTQGYFDPLLALFEHAVTERFMKPEHRDLLIVAPTPATALDRMHGIRPPPAEKWLDRSRT